MKKSRKESIIKKYRLFRHRFNYNDNYFKGIIITLLILLLVDLVVLFIIW